MKLLQSGANSEITDKKGNTPLQLATNKNLKDIADVIKNNQSCELCNNFNNIYYFHINFTYCSKYVNG